MYMLAASACVASMPECPVTFLRTSFEGGDIANLAANSSRDCCVECSNHYACAAWTLYQGVCYLKDVRSSINGTKCTTCISGLAAGTATTNKTCDIHSGYDTTPDGENFASVPAVTPQECCGACSETLACKAWTLFGGVCYMKSKFSHMQPCASCVSGIMSGP